MIWKIAMHALENMFIRILLSILLISQLISCIIYNINNLLRAIVDVSNFKMRFGDCKHQYHTSNTTREFRHFSCNQKPTVIKILFKFVLPYHQIIGS
jgi:hypothetical protein